MNVNPTQGLDGHGAHGRGFHARGANDHRADGIGVRGTGANGTGIRGIGSSGDDVSDDGVNVLGFNINGVDGTGVGPEGMGHAPHPPCFALTALLRDLQPHTELDLRTLAYHLQQSDATAADGYCHAAINEARSFLEALVVNVVHAVQRDARDRGANDGVSNGTRNGARNDARHGAQNGTAFRNYRRYLRDAGLIDAEENELLRFVYGVASAKGSHHGVTDEAWTRLARRIVFAAGQYMVQRYATWKRSGGPVASPTDRPSPRPRRRWLPRLFAGHLGRGRRQRW